MNTVSVRKATVADLETLAMLFRDYRQFQGQVGNITEARQFLEERLKQNESVLFLAHVATNAVGFAQLYPSFSSVALARVFILNDLFVSEQVRRKGVASALLSAIETHAWSLGSVRVTLNVARNNATAQAFYAAYGWQQDAQFFMFHRYPPSHGSSSKGEA